MVDVDEEKGAGPINLKESRQLIVEDVKQTSNFSVLAFNAQSMNCLLYTSPSPRD